MTAPAWTATGPGQPVVNEKLAANDGRWPRFAPRALEAGFQSAHALPMRLRGLTIGALNLFRADEGEINTVDVLFAQAFADVATIAILNHRGITEAHVVNEQLHVVSNARVIIEQAKGVLAERSGIDMEEAFSQLRDRARAANRRLVDVAQDVLGGTSTAPGES